MATLKKQNIIEARYVKPGQKAQDLVGWKKHDSEIRGKDGTLFYQKKSILAPESWSGLAIDIAASKYFRKSAQKEDSIRALVNRIGKGLFRAAEMSGLFHNKKEISSFVEEIKFILLTQKAAFNSPVWFNLGLSEAYGIKSKSEHYVWNAKLKRAERVRDSYRSPQTSACFIQSVEDSLDSIFNLVKSEARLFKYGSGSGTNFSNLRGKNESLSSGGNSSGLISFLEIFDKAAGAIKSGGTTRRAAKMVCVDVDHPEIEDFIKWKWVEEKKAKALIDAGYSADLDGETYRTISGQNANNSVRVPDRFMKSVLNKSTWILKNRVGQKKFSEVPAEKLWTLICESAWHCADPGLQFDDTINRFHTCSETDRIYASNPCSEYMFLNDSACNLASLNLIHFLDENQNFKLDEFKHVVRCVFVAQECLINYSSYPTALIAENSYKYRPLGLGFANLGSFFMRQALGYDSPEARAWAGFITATLTGEAYRTSALMAKKTKAFEAYSKNKSSMLKVLNRHRAGLKDIEFKYLPQEFKAESKKLWDEVLLSGRRYGYRNAQATAIAPTGTIALVMDCDTTGIEPDFSLIKNKKLSGGGYLQIANQSVGFALKKLNYNSAEQKLILENLEAGISLNKCGIKPEHLRIFACATGEMALSADAHLSMMAAVQPFVSGAISKTVNLPETATIHDISETYLKAWRLGLKSIAVYRDGSKFVQPLNQKSKPENPACVQCGFATILEAGCFRCTNCGHTTACSS